MHSGRKIKLGAALLVLATLACNLPVRGNAIQHAVSATLTAAAGTPLAAPVQPATALPPIPAATAAPPQDEPGWVRYRTRAGDTLPALAGRFGVNIIEIRGTENLSPDGLLPVGQELRFPNPGGLPCCEALLLPDAEIPNSPVSAGFDLQQTVQTGGGYLSRYAEEVDGEWLSGAEIIRRIALDTSTNPRLLLAVLEYRSGWWSGEPAGAADNPFPIGFKNPAYQGLHKELTLTARMLTVGFYGWRAGSLTRITFGNGQTRQLDATLNAGTAALQNLFAYLSPTEAGWQAQLKGDNSFTAFYARQFGDPWARAADIELLFFGLAQPDLALPFLPGKLWSLTGGPHITWGTGTPWGALDFAPAGERSGCYISPSFTTAAAAGVVVRAERGQVLLDLDGDGDERTGWVLLYMHIAGQDRAAVGTRLNADDPLGHPSCEGGRVTGTHMHIARKYNGEWLGVDGPLPFVLSGWQAVKGAKPYLGGLILADQYVTAKSDGSHKSVIQR